MDSQLFREWGHRIVDWMADYYEGVAQYPVKSPAAPGDILNNLPPQPPQSGEDMAQIFADFEQLILPGMTHWQHPGFMAYFPANTSYPSLLAEMLTAALGAQCMIWDTSPAAAELEQRVMEWLRDLIGVPAAWQGVIQSTASDATLCAILTARERHSRYTVNAGGLQQQPCYRVYASEQIHSSIEKDVKIAGLGHSNYVPIRVDGAYAMRPEALRAAIVADLDRGHVPLCIVAGLGTTGSTAVDPLPALAEIAREFGIWLHVDAAYAGSALILPEYQSLLRGIEAADSLVFNPHKWLFTNFDCSAYFVKDADALKRTFSITPEYLKTARDQEVNNYRDWGVPLGRRFRALKLWFVMRSFGVDGMQKILRNHIHWAQDLAETIRQTPGFEILAPVNFNLICFRHCPEFLPEDAWNDWNARLVQAIQATGRLYLTHTTLAGRYSIRLVAGQTYLRQEHLAQAWEIIQTCLQAQMNHYKEV